MVLLREESFMVFPRCFILVKVIDFIELSSKDLLLLSLFFHSISGNILDQAVVRLKYHFVVLFLGMFGYRYKVMSER